MGQGKPRTRVMTDEEMQDLACSFCATEKREVARLFISSQGPHFICSECVTLFHELLREEGEAHPRPGHPA